MRTSTSNNLHDMARKASRDRSGKRVYLACPLPLFGTVRYARAQRRVRERFRRALLLLPDQLFANREAWLTGWHLVSRDLTDLVILTDGAGYVGRGTYDEVQSARAAGAHIWLLTPEDEWVTGEQLLFSTPNALDWRRYSRVTVRPAAE